MRIGLLEENAALAEFFCAALGLAGHTVDVHASAVSLLESLSTSPRARMAQCYDLLILDIRIDTPDELALLTQFEDILPGQPFMVISSSRPSQITRAMQAHPTIGFLLKPFHMRVLSAHIERQGKATMQPAETSAGG